MNFASLTFWTNLSYAFIICIIVSFLVSKFKAEWSNIVGKLCFVATSFYLLGSESVTTLVVFIWVISIGWIIIKLLSLNCSAGLKKITIVSLIIFALLPLFYFKYLGFVFNDLLGLGIQYTHALIPMGLSFYTFQTISFAIDTMKKEEKVPKFIDYLNFASFFPQIVAGPIERRSDLLHQVESLKFTINKDSLDKAISWIVLGLFYKIVLADNLGVILGEVKVDPSNMYHVICEMVGYSFRVYFDFSGYSFVALGLGHLFGIKLTLNFNSPYWSLNLQDFWRRWHITLSQWLRDYIYIPLGGSKRGILLINLLITFVISGIWHGAGVNYILWGLLHGIGVIYCIYGLKKKLWIPLRWFITSVFITYTWLFFYETNTQILEQKALLFFQLDNYYFPNLSTFQSMLGNKTNLLNFVFVIGMSYGVIVLEGLSLRIGKSYSILRTTPASAIMAFLIVVLAPMSQPTFIYFNF